MSVKTTTTLHGRNIDDQLEALSRQGRLRSLELEIAEQWLENTHERFESEIDPEGNKWQKNAPSTLTKKRNPKILQEKGDRGGLKGTLNYQIGGKIELGSPSPYARIHQQGGKTGKNLAVKIPKRTYLGVSTQDSKDFNEIISDHLNSI